MKEQLFKKYKELIIGIVIIIFAIVYFIGSFSIKQNKVVSIGAEFMPRLYGLILFILALLQIYKGLIYVKKYKITEEKFKAEEDNKDTKNVILTFLLILLYISTMEVLGFILSSALFLFVMSFLLSPANAKVNNYLSMIYSIILSICIYVLFHNFMFMPLPKGII
ncbi:MAG: tripartite tricarboxylate transporter TctB family protein [Tepidanaerobacteraceae bacterium]|jgi:ABC-type multidrug transport system permease subunit|nr:tripartite tricarboxylate transporter TctB family protein [Tepidanaerobacteraceae bacterium]